MTKGVSFSILARQNPERFRTKITMQTKSSGPGAVAKEKCTHSDLSCGYCPLELLGACQSERDT
jgi:hypothetical protein